MKNSKFKIQNCRYLFYILPFVFCLLPVAAQSTSQNYPTPILTNEVDGKIPARDIGDARLTTYYYLFKGGQGDIFINVVTDNFDGDIDIFTAGGLKPLTKIKVYSDASDKETGRIVYLRQPEKLILRIEGRTPNDDAAVFRIKFAGSFAPVTETAEAEEPKLPEIKTETQPDVQVNSVGTIVSVKPKPAPSPKEITDKKQEETVAEDRRQENRNEELVEDDAEKKQDKSDEKKLAEKKAVQNKSKEKKKSEIETKADAQEKPAPVVEITDALAEKKKLESEKTKDETKTEVSENKTEAKPKKNPIKKSIEPNPLASIYLVVSFKDGSKIERPMTEVLRVSVDKGILTIISKDGSVGRYSILDVAEMTIK